MKYLEVFENEKNVKAFFSTKEGAVSGAPGGTVFDNEDLFREMGLANQIKIWPKQVHGTNVDIVREDDIKTLGLDAEHGLIIPETDGTITNVKGVLLTSVHADCLPVYLYDSRNQIIGLVHAGWRGAVAGIVPQAIRKMVYVLGASLDDIKLHIGPGISQCCFEVGAEVASQFLLEWGASFAEEKESDGPEAKYLLDLKAAVKHQALSMKLKEENITISKHCTYCEPELFCSYRREGGTYQRMGAGICLL